MKELGIDTLALMRKIKLAMDPLYESTSSMWQKHADVLTLYFLRWLLNPGKIVDVIQI